jgi:hypothetical protein
MRARFGSGGESGEVLASPHFEVRRAEQVAEVVRTEQPFATLAELERAHGQLEDVLDTMPRAKMALLVDLRRAPSRNDPEFERIMSKHRHLMFDGWKLRAIVVRSAVGKLQVQRYARDDGFDVEVFTDVAAAREHLRAGLAAQR